MNDWVEPFDFASVDDDYMAQQSELVDWGLIQAAVHFHLEVGHDELEASVVPFVRTEEYGAVAEFAKYSAMNL